MAIYFWYFTVKLCRVKTFFLKKYVLFSVLQCWSKRYWCVILISYYAATVANIEIKLLQMKVVESAYCILLLMFLNVAISGGKGVTYFLKNRYIRVFFWWCMHDILTENFLNCYLFIYFLCLFRFVQISVQQFSTWLSSCTKVGAL